MPWGPRAAYENFISRKQQFQTFRSKIYDDKKNSCLLSTISRRAGGGGLFGESDGLLLSKAVPQMGSAPSAGPAPLPPGANANQAALRDGGQLGAPGAGIHGFNPAAGPLMQQSMLQVSSDRSAYVRRCLLFLRLFLRTASGV